MTASPESQTRYRWQRALVLRPFGLVVSALGVLWIIGVLIDSRVGGGISSGVRLGGLLVTIAVLAAGGWLLIRPPLVLELSSTGYRVRHLRGGGVGAADWRQVETVQTQRSGDGTLVVVSLAGGGRSVVPLSLLGPRAAEAEREIHDRLNTAHGYRPLGG